MFQDFYTAELIGHLNEEAQRRGYHLVLDQVGGEEGCSSVEDGKVAGALMTFPHAAREAAMRIAQRVPVVVLGGHRLDSPGAAHVAPDSLRAGALALQYLQSKGCRRPVFVYDDTDANPVHTVRWEAFRRAARRAGVDATAIIAEGAGSREPAFWTGVRLAADLDAAVREMTSLTPRPDGLFVPTDACTVRTYPLLRAQGVEPERDVRIISCDNVRHTGAASGQHRSQPPADRPMGNRFAGTADRALRP
jgi:DNA-binding LacI/PurR family transcriptional regulator